MRQFVFIISLISSACAFGQLKKIAGTYNDVLQGATITFKEDSTFEYVAKGEHPIFYRWENFSEKGRWTISGDTLMLNPQLPKKAFVESDFEEAENNGDSNFLLTFNHIKRHIDVNGNIVSTDTLQIARLDYSFNVSKRRKQTRVSPYRTTRCTFAGYIPKEIITTSRTIVVPKPPENINKILIGCYELQGMKEFIIKNPNSNQFTLNVYSNYYLDGQIRQVKMLVKNENVIYTKQKANGAFEKDNIWYVNNAKLIRQKSGG